MAKKRYQVYSAHGDDLAGMCSALLREIEPEGKAVRLVFFGSPEDNADYLRQLNLIREAVGERFGAERPVLSYVAQKPLEGSLKMEVTYEDPAEILSIKYGDNYMVIEDGVSKELIVGGVLPSDIDSPVYDQSAEVFERIRQILAEEGFHINSIVRQWNYIERITGMDRGRQHYQDFNDARTRFYALAEWHRGYPAATGIGTQLGGIMVELNALAVGPGMIDAPLDNKLQVAAHRYSQGILLGKKNCGFNEKTTPKFERARIIGYHGNATVYISGTAAIRGEESLAGMDITEQTRVTMENIEYLVSEENLRPLSLDPGVSRKFELLRVYIKFPDQLHAIRGYLDRHYPDVQKFYLYADVCREELLVEIEGIAGINRSK